MTRPLTPNPDWTLVMTGATRGLGLVAARSIVSTDRSCHLVVLARGGGPAGFVDGFGEGAGRVIAVDTDLADTAGTMRAAAEIRRMLDDATLPPLRGLAGNAGIQYLDDEHVTADGLEATFAVNVLANHLLIGELVRHLTRGSRITITVSDTHFGDLRHNLGMVPAPRWTSPARLSRPGAFGRSSPAAGRTAYSTSKLAAIHLVHEWARRLPDGVEIVSYNPGYVPGTDLARAASAPQRFANRWVLPGLTLVGPFDRVPTAGRRLAETILGVPQAVTGAYIDRGRVSESSADSRDPDRERDLWDHLEYLRVETFRRQ
ncbi:SDR family NAD(P)-dependent oxidoreductase [Gordonia sp. JH63]|uniref:SDR family NAD(P)-dependent oxidoreductase n=1 Tax=Gordonia sp. JH63 TaxID=2698900 RepID=UPI00131F95CC|nr:SDR family NAD(P)-dependent oxidoreductase [Gordonia sp. JH63]QHD84529.1 SDR family NAD(P)-dependent oxidoreductase [Gordonia sp. JH63]